MTNILKYSKNIALTRAYKLATASILLLGSFAMPSYKVFAEDSFTLPPIPEETPNMAVKLQAEPEITILSGPPSSEPTSLTEEAPPLIEITYETEDVSESTSPENEADTETNSNNASDALSQTQLTSISGRATILNGSRLNIDGRDILLFGIDAPDVNEPLGVEARAFLTDIVDGQNTLCYLLAELENGPAIGLCGSSAASDLSEALLRAGLAKMQEVAANDPGIGPFYIAAETEAKNQSLGLWAENIDTNATLTASNDILNNIIEPSESAAEIAEIEPEITSPITTTNTPTIPHYISSGRPIIPPPPQRNFLLAAAEIIPSPVPVTPVNEEIIPSESSAATTQRPSKPVVTLEIAEAPQIIEPEPEPAIIEESTPIITAVTEPIIEEATPIIEVTNSPDTNEAAEDNTEITDTNIITNTEANSETTIENTANIINEDTAVITETAETPTPAVKKGFFAMIFGAIASFFELIERFQVIIIGGLLIVALRQIFAEVIFAFETQTQMRIDRETEERSSTTEYQARIERADNVISFANALLAEVSTLHYDLASRADIARIASRHEDIEDIIRSLHSLHIAQSEIFNDWQGIGALGYKAAYEIRAFANQLKDTEARLVAFEKILRNDEADFDETEELEIIGGLFDEASHAANTLHDGLHDLIGKRVQRRGQMDMNIAA